MRDIVPSDGCFNQKLGILLELVEQTVDDL